MMSPPTDFNAQVNETLDVNTGGTYPRALSTFVEVNSDTPVRSRNDGAAHDESEKDPLETGSEAKSKSTDSASVFQNEYVLDEVTIVTFEKDDPTNPYNWTRKKKTYVLITSMVLVFNSTVGSALPSGATKETQEYFGITNESLLVLPVSIYLIGYVLGPLVFAPLSESYGRKWVVLITFIFFMAFHLGCALAPSFSGLVIMRLLTGIGASTPVSTIGGIYADIYSTPKARGRAITAFMAATTWGPLAGPIISGYVAAVSWRWTYWCALIISGATFPFVLFLPETYGPILLKHRAEKLRKETGNQSIAAPIELEDQTWREFFTVVLTRPLRMLLFEWIVLFSCLYLSVAYAIFYMFFQAYPIIFSGDTYGFNVGQQGLAFLPIGIGAMFAGGIYLVWEHHLDVNRSKQPPPAWSHVEEYVRLPIACLGAPLFVVSLFWLAWTAKPDIHWIVPILSGLPFGVGFLLIFMALVNYMVDAYEAFAASALGAASCSRSIFAVVVPFAARPMYNTLGISWACSLLGFLSLIMGIVPFMFLRYGGKIRANSVWCQQLKKQKVEEDEKRLRTEQRQESVPGELAEKMV